MELRKIETIYVACGLNSLNKGILRYFKSESWVSSFVSASSITALPNDKEMEKIARASGYCVVFPPGIKGGLDGSSSNKAIDLMGLKDLHPRSSIFYVDRGCSIHFGLHSIALGNQRALRIVFEGGTVLSVQNVSMLAKKGGRHKVGFLPKTNTSLPDYSTSKIDAGSLVNTGLISMAS